MEIDSLLVEEDSFLRDYWKKKEKKKESKHGRKKKKGSESKVSDSSGPEDDKVQDDQGMAESNILDPTHLITLIPSAEKKINKNRSTIQTAS
jgi:hypothetical protein